MTLGAFLVARREARGLSVADLARTTRIAPGVVQDLETDQLDKLPAGVYVRGFIRAYCGAVGAPPDEALALYEAALGARREATAAPALAPPPRAILRGPSAKPSGPRQAAGLAMGLAVMLLLAAALYPFGAAWLTRSRATSDGGGAGDVAPVRVAAMPTPSPGTVSAPPASASGPVKPPDEGASGPARASARMRVLVIRADATTWIRVKPDDEPAWVETLAPGTEREWRTAGRFHVTLGNAGGVRLELDGQKLPRLGKPGEVVRDVTLPSEPGS
jgi:cytoskeleton protein RodZ